ncbi:cytochrome c oxidase subunit 3 [Chryseolinea sp. T2]|uniref:cytochrome c oxidase subunit 3 n=1 Tax=Chryseolinea sp. T2 TaxID=3129255 RepID=UPI0030781B53
MATDIRIVEEASKPRAMDPKKFGMWLFIVSATMVFAALTSAYLVRQAAGNWLVFDLPSLFGVTTTIIILSSVSMQWAYIAAKRNNLEMTKVAICITALLGGAFFVGQFKAWGALVNQSVYLVGNPAGSFVYVLSGLHMLHIVGGVVYLMIVLVATFRYKVHSRRLAQMELCATYWHFLGALWLYLYVFLLLNR